MTIEWRSPVNVAGMALAAIGGAAVYLAAVQQATPMPQSHAPIQVHRNPNGTPARGLRNELQSSNWSGYEVAYYQTGQKYTSAQLTWVVPTVFYGSSTDSTSSSEYSANWVGIGGFCENVLCTKGDRTLIQLGTEQDVSPSGTTNYYAWYEMLPQAETQIQSLAVRPGDVMTATLSCGTTCSRRTQTWLLIMTNNTTGATWSGSFSYASAQLSAEWIEEAPYSGGILPLANFGTANFRATSGAGGLTPSLSVAQNGIQLADPWGQTSNPSAPTALDDFDACWGFQAFASCQSP